jgi:hypothetical protein
MRKLLRREPFVINKKLGSVLVVSPEDLTSTNEDGEPTVIPTGKQKFEFDRKGWFLFSGLLSDSDVQETRDFATTIWKDPGSLPAVAAPYNQVDGGWAPPMQPEQALLDEMPPMRRTLFRDRHITNNVECLSHNRLFRAST